MWNETNFGRNGLRSEKQASISQLWLHSGVTWGALKNEYQRYPLRC